MRREKKPSTHDSRVTTSWAGPPSLRHGWHWLNLTGRLLRQGFLYTHIPQVEFVGGGSFRLSCMWFCCAAVTQVRHARRHSGGARLSTSLHGRVESFRRMDKALHADAVSCLWMIVIVKAVLLHGAMVDIRLCEPKAADSTVHHVARVF